MSRLTKRARQKTETFLADWRTDGPNSAIRGAVTNARYSVEYWRECALVRLGLRQPRPPVPYDESAAAYRVISVVVTVSDTPPAPLRACFDSILDQLHPAWELCVCDDHSSAAETLDVLAGYRGSDPRIRIVRAGERLGVAGATDLAAEQASGEFLVLIEPEGTLRPEDLATVSLSSETAADIDVVRMDGTADIRDGTSSLRPPLVMRKSLYWRLHGMSGGEADRPGEDLERRAAASARQIHHVGPRLP